MGLYEKVYVLNMVVLDLMILMNVIVEEEKGVLDGVKREVVEGLVRMMVLIMFVFVEECWVVFYFGEMLIFKSEKGRFLVVDGMVDLL